MLETIFQSQFEMSFMKFVVVLVIFGRCHANVYDCKADPSGQPEHIYVKETDRIGTVLATFNNSYGDLGWTATSNGTNKEYLSQFFKSAESESDTHEHLLQLAKILDLELLELELVSAYEMFTSSQTTSYTIDLIVRCNHQDNREKKEMLFRVEIQSVNEFYPQFIGAPFTTVISEATEIGSVILNVGSRATDLDAGQTNLTFAIAPYMITQFDGSRFVRMDETGNGLILLRWPLDFESFLNTGRTFMFINVTVSDDGGLTSSTSINVTVTDANDQGIQFIYPGCARPCIQANYTVTTNESYVGLLQVEPASVKAGDLDTLNESVIYRIISDMDIPFLSMNEGTGELFKTTPLVNDSLGYEITIWVRVQESSDANHYLDTNITVYISDRKPHPESTASPTAGPLHQRSDIECYSDSFAILLPDTLLPEVRNVTWREEICKVNHNGSHYLSTIMLTECGTTVRIENDTVTFSNDLIVHKTDANRNTVDDRSITYGEDYETVIPVKCIYPRYNNVSSSYIPVKQNVRFFEKRYGDLDVAMQQFESEQFDTAVDAGNYPRKIPLDDDVFVRVGLNFDPENLRVKTDQCIATSMPSPADKNWRPLIQKGCPQESVRLLSTVKSSDVKFAFKAFDFRHNSSGFVYIHCEVSVCDTNDESCTMGCESRAKRSVSSRQKSHLVSTGPLFVERKQQQSTGVVAVPTIVAAVCVLVAMAAIVVAVIGWKRTSGYTPAAI